MFVNDQTFVKLGKAKTLYLHLASWLHDNNFVRIDLDRYDTSRKYAIIHDKKVSKDDAKITPISIKGIDVTILWTTALGIMSKDSKGRVQAVN